MMSFRFKIFTIILSVLFSSLACVTVMGAQLPSESAPSGAPAIESFPTIQPALETCPVVTDKIMAAATTFVEGESELLDEEVYLVTYLVEGDKIFSPQYEDVSAELQEAQNDAALHQQVWSYFTALIPVDQREVIREYSIITDGQDGSLAAVTQTWDDPNHWALEVDIADSREYYNLTFTLVHEFGHLLTLGPEQVPPSIPVFTNPEDDDLYFEEVSQCPQYFPGEGCANPDSYINAFFNRFWADIHEEWNDINLEEDEDTYYIRLDEFYYKYEDHFLTDYAATNPEEDIAESWSFFVLAPKPAGDIIAEQKILFFYEYPELVQLRAQILNNLCNSFPE